jgi:hypothetical protein
MGRVRDILDIADEDIIILSNISDTDDNFKLL